MAKYFGTDGIRGRYGIELSNSLAFKVGQSLKSALGTSRLVIGMDTRESSNELLYSVVSGAQSFGIDVMIAGVVSTPMISHYSKQKNISGVMITASHNPYTDNGIKVFNNGNKLSESQELTIEEFIDNNKSFTVKTIGKTYSGEEVFDLYADLIESLELVESDYRIGFDSANGANYLISLGVLRELCKDFIQIGNKPDGKNINEGVGSTHLESIIKLVKENNLDIGFSFDGDGDRILVIDSELNIIDGDLLIYIIAVYLKNNNLLKKDTVVLTSMSNLGIIKAFERQGIKVILTDVGDKYVLEKLNEEGYSIGGENSGHIILRDFINTGDGVLVAAYLLKILNDTKKSLKELTSDIKMWPQKMVNVRTFNKEILMDERVVKVVDEVKDIFGLDGKVLVRASGTEPLVRVTLSCELESDLDKYMEQIVSTINFVKEEV
ncbi:MAG: phosphoglucosamine mutase [Candidatus Izimaplasma sp.]|nr:phosphoglucosamine mutase [Candidatus Izimaplasma bacterium]